RDAPGGRGQMLEWRETAGTVKDEVVLKRHVADGNVFLRDERQVAVRSSDRQQSDETGIDVGRSEPMKMAVIPIQSLRHVPWNVLGVRVGHARREVQQHIVGSSPWTDMRSVGVEIDRRGGHLLRVERNGLTLWRVLRNEVVLDGQAAEPVLEMDDQPFAGKYVQRGRRIEIVAGAVPVGRRAA